MRRKSVRTIVTLVALGGLGLLLSACHRYSGGVTETPALPQGGLVVTTLTPLPSQVATSTSTLPAPTPSPSPAASVTIERFEVAELQELDPGKRVTFSWSADGVAARIVSGMGQAPQDEWVVPLEGTLTVDVAGGVYRDPEFVLEVYDNSAWLTADPSQMISQTVQIEWPCEEAYFFTPEPKRCPGGPVEWTWAAEAGFERGRMIWLENLQAIYVFYTESVVSQPGYTVQGHFQRFEDTFVEGEPETDPAFVPPEGLQQPVRGFGKVWRTYPEVQDQLGWVEVQELLFGGALQYEQEEAASPGARAYLKTIDDQTIWFLGTDSGTWGFVTP